MITSGEARPFAASVAIVHGLAPAGHVWPAALQILATPTLTKVEDVLPEFAVAVDRDNRDSCGGSRRDFLNFLLWQLEVIQVRDLRDPCSITIVLDHHLMRNSASDDLATRGKHLCFMIKIQQD
jgi:hypothetical protein